MKVQRLRSASGELIPVHKPDELDRIVFDAPVVRNDVSTVADPHEAGHGHHVQIEQASDLAGLHGAEVVLFGAGAVASWVAFFLGFLELVIYAFDMDKVEPANTYAGRTLYGPVHIDQYKSNALKGIVESFYPGTRIHAYPYKLEEVPDIEIQRLAERCNLVYLLVDDPAALDRVNAIAYPRTMLLHAGLHRGARSGHVILSGAGLPCLRCSLGLNQGERLQPLHAEPALGCDISSIAHLAATMGLDLLMAAITGRPITRWDVNKNMVYVTNYADQESPDGPGFLFEAATKDPSCPVCGTT